ncbi:MAG: hypothetical protein AB2A00_33240 [Myxococcota bacterium]
MANPGAMDNTAQCRRTSLAQSPLCRIEVCGCGHLHLTVQAVTLRLDAGAFEHLTAQMGEALYQLVELQRRGEVTDLEHAVHPPWGAPPDGRM